MKYTGIITINIEPFEAESRERAEEMAFSFLQKLPFEDSDPCTWKDAEVSITPQEQLDGTQTKGMKGIPADWDEDFR